ncbi:MAG: MFS transporter, partial [Lacticaseibacillus paracasei]|nr:MFS transporter [Lacticaseibacillus paracasei]
TWLLLAEMFPGKVKAQFMSVATATTWITNFFISLIYPQLIAWLGTAVVFFVVLSTSVAVFLSAIKVPPLALLLFQKFHEIHILHR